MKKSLLLILIAVLNGVIVYSNELAECITTGNIEKAKQIIASDKNISKKEIEDILEGAIEQGNNELAKFILENKKITIRKERAIFAALGNENHNYQNYNMEMIKYLLTNCKETIKERRYYDSTTSLMIAVKTGNMEIVKLFIENGAELNLKNWNGETVLSYAIEKEAVDIVKYLIKSGASLKNIDRYGYTYLMASKNEEISQELLKNGAEVDFSGIRIVLEPKCMANTKTVAELMLKMGININERDEEGKTALFYTKNIEVTKYLVENGSKINIKDSGGKTPLITKICSFYIDENRESIKYLIENGANVNTLDLLNCSALDYAIDYGNQDAAMLLIEKGANINKKDLYGKTLLMKAIQSYQFDIAKLLITKGVDREATDGNKKTALDYAMENNSTEIIELLKK